MSRDSALIISIALAALVKFKTVSGSFVMYTIDVCKAIART
jgi:hypothetical protein